MRKLIFLSGILGILIVLSMGFVGGGSVSALPVTAAVSAAGTTTSGAVPDVVVEPVQEPPISKQLTQRAKSSWPWYVTRASGLVAAASLALLMLSGIGFISGKSFRFLEPLTAWATHKAVGLLFGISVLVHIGALLFDKVVPFTVVQALVPFASRYKEVTIAGHNFGSVYVTLGILAFYVLLAIIITSLAWIDKRPHTWKIFHFLAYLVLVLVFFHALYLGTDLAHGILRVLWIVMGIAIGIAALLRFRRSSK